MILKIVINFILIFIHFIPSSFGQELEKISPEFGFAGYLKNNNRFYEAITEYKRFICFCENDSLITEANYLISQSYIAARRWGQASVYLNKTLDYGINPEAQLDLAESYYRMGLYPLARLENSELLSMEEFRRYHSPAGFLNGLSYVQEFKWQDAVKCFESVKGYSASDRILLQLKNSEKIPHRSPKAAYWISTFIPGGGQIYSGKILHGMFALILNGAAGYYMYDRWKEKDYVSFLGTYFFIWGRYYTANRTNARQFAEEFNLKQKNKFRESVLKTVKEGGF